MVAERTRKRTVYVIFIGAVIFGAVNFAGRGRNAEGDVTAPAIEPMAAATVGGLDAADTDAAESYEWRRDPFAYGQSMPVIAGGETRVTRFQLEAMSEANGHLMAIINGKPLSRGEAVDGWTVVRLTKSTATLEQNGKEILLEMRN